MVGLFSVTLVVAVFQVVARNAFGGGFIWGPDLIQLSVLWITMLGAMSAVGSDSHIRIDLAARLFNDRWRDVATRITNAGAAVVCGVLAWFSAEFVADSFAFGAPGFAGIAEWVFQCVIPVAAAIMTLRYTVQIVHPVQK